MQASQQRAQHGQEERRRPDRGGSVPAPVSQIVTCGNAGRHVEGVVSDPLEGIHPLHLVDGGLVADGALPLAGLDPHVHGVVAQGFVDALGLRRTTQHQAAIIGTAEGDDPAGAQVHRIEERLHIVQFEGCHGHPGEATVCVPNGERDVHLLAAGHAPHGHFREHQGQARVLAQGLEVAALPGVCPG